MARTPTKSKAPMIKTGVNFCRVAATFDCATALLAAVLAAVCAAAWEDFAAD